MVEPSETTQRVVERLRQLRRAAGMSGAKLAEEMRSHGLSAWLPATVSKLETGRREAITVDELEALSQIFRVPLAALVETECQRCRNTPPEGFTCKACGRA